MSQDKFLTEADFWVVPEGWEPKEEEWLPDGRVLFVVHLRNREPVTLESVPTQRMHLVFRHEQGEALRPAQVEIPGGMVLDIYFSREGAVVSGEKPALLIPSGEPFRKVEDVSAALSRQGYRLMTAFEPLPGPPEPIPPRPHYEPRECPGPPRHVVNVSSGHPYCPIHDVEVEPA